jgi:hypothetical protein
LKRALSLISVVDHGANFGVEFFLHAADDRVLFGAASTAGAA